MGRFSPSVLPSGVNPFAEMLDRGHESFDRHRQIGKQDEEREWARERMEMMDKMEQERHADSRALLDLEFQERMLERGGGVGRPPGEPHVTEGADLSMGMQPPSSERVEHTPFGPFGTGQMPGMGMGDATGSTGQSPVGEYIQGEDIHKYVPIEAGRFEGYVARPGVQEAEQREQEAAYLSRIFAQLYPDQAGRAEPVAGLMAGGYGDPSGYFEEDRPEPPVPGTQDWLDWRRQVLDLESEYDTPGGGGPSPRTTPTYGQAMEILKDHYAETDEEGYITGYSVPLSELDALARSMAAGEEAEFPSFPGGGAEPPGAPDMRGPFPTEEPASGARAFFERLIPEGLGGFPGRGMEPEYDMDPVQAQPPAGRTPGEPPRRSSRNVGREGPPPGEREAGGEGVELSAEELQQAREILEQFPREQWEEILREEGATPRQIAQIIGG